MLSGAFLPAVVLPYGWMVWRSLQETTFSFAGPLGAMDDIVAQITRRIYRDIDPSASAGWSDKFEFLRWFGGDILWQLTLPGFLLALAGLAVLLAPPRRNRQGSPRTLGALDWAARCAGPAAFLGSSVVLLWLLNSDYDFFHVQVVRAYPLVCYGLLAIWTAIGLQQTVSGSGAALGGPRSGDLCC